MKKLGLLLLCLTMILSCVACGQEKEDIGAEIAMYLSTPIYNFDPAYAYTDEATAQVLSLLYTGLTTLDEDGDIKPGLAQEWEIISDDKAGEYAIEFRLYENICWSDGSAITSTDFVYSWTRLLNPAFTSEAASLLFEVKNARAYKNCEINSQFDIGIIPLETDLLRVEFDRKIDFDRFLVNCSAIALAPVNEDYVIIHPDWATNPTLITTPGQFMVRTFKRDNRLVLERNQYYRRDIKHDKTDKYIEPKTLIVDMTKSAADQIAAFEAGTLFFVGNIPLANRAAYKDSKLLEKTDSLTTHTYIFNTQRAPFHNPAVRKALSLAIDRADIAAKVVFAKSAKGFVPDGAWESDPDELFRAKDASLISAAADMATAQQMIAAANLSAQDKVIEIAIRPNEVDRLVAQTIQASWAQLGFTVQIRELGVVKHTSTTNKTDYDLLLDTFRQAYESKDFDVIAIVQTMLSPDPMTVLSGYASDFCGTATDNISDVYNVTHASGYSSLRYDALIEQAFMATDPAERTLLLQKAEALLMEDMPATPIFVYENAYLVSKELSRLKFSYDGTYIFTKLKLKNFEDYLTQE